ncbi:glycine/D-amino acid oxidase-like deaminating enzyme [Rhodovulum imhoffii]|uniref:Glycine/D-amino acid oxidase-like deaminating enzyme n=1 Tax=Rhodovulum imhoffii TaxID=365340 RepID=A0A2T5BU79_9RHOB|nr:FAD-dependent oxidoreductase [Rhodovulum imhoffii]MBK5934558.1 FAD-dependent oxidoreductase [Rhodovulum imhoffii]PTN03025.1 glycine/D-amino acid oxidase-like deaminating enzyme [Rhodovulum imhoffii]
MATVDITVMGAGVFGLATAWVCVRRGARVRVVEWSHPGAGASGTPVGALSPHVPEQWNAKKAFQFDSLIAAHAFWAGVEAASGQGTGYARLGRYQPIGTEAALERAQARAAQAEDLWQGKARWSVVPAVDGGVFVPRSPTGMLVFDTLSARIAPRAACTALARAIVAEGGEVCCGAEGPQQGRVIWATGYPGLAMLSAELGAQVGNGVKGQAAILGHDAGPVPQIHADGVLIVPHADGTVAVGSTSERDFTDPFATDERLDDVIARARAVCPALARAPVIERWAGIRPRASSIAPMLGPWPGRAGHFVANGGFKIGIGLAPEVARIMADLVLDGHDEIPDTFRVEANL